MNWRTWFSAAMCSASSTKSNSILVDEARTPLIISGPSDDKSDLYNSINVLLPQLVEADYELDEKQRTVNLTEAGNEHMEELLGRHRAPRTRARSTMPPMSRSFITCSRP